MKKRPFKTIPILLGTCLLVLFHLFTAAPTLAHWADLAVADITIAPQTTHVTLTFPTGLIPAADDDRDGKLSAPEITAHQAMLQRHLGEKIQITNGLNQPGILTVSPSDLSALPPNLQSSTATHSTVKLVYAWRSPTNGVKIRYNLFEPGVATARCLATITAEGAALSTAAKGVKNVIFSPENLEFSLTPNAPLNWAGGIWVTIAGAFLWGAAHALSPGHGKTLVGAYLMGERATARHALFLGLTTTITHTLGVFTLGIVALLASKSFVPEQLFPWLSLISGLMVVVIGGNLLRDRLRPTIGHRHRRNQPRQAMEMHHGHDSHGHGHDHGHDHGHGHSHGHSHDHHDHSHHPSDHDPSHHDPSHPERMNSHSHSHGSHSHSHLPPEGVSWKNLAALGVSGGMIPCPSALVLLLSSIALGQVAYGLILVISFSLGLAAVLTGLGLMLVYSKQIFAKLPVRGGQRFARVRSLIPTLTAIVITLIGLGISIQAIGQIGAVKL
jgi:nickel/cobalt transporter (NicO) family protein